MLPDSSDGYTASSSDGYKMLASALTPANALEGLDTAKLYDYRVKSDTDNDVNLEDVILELGFYAQDFE